MTATVRVTAPAKINLHLEVLGLRDDGFHELAMVMQTIDLADQLTCHNTSDGLIHLSCDVDGLSTGNDNLIVRAAELLRSRSGFNELGAKIHLTKRIPIGAGLAGGSSDGAAALVALNTLWGLGHSRQSLESLAAELGSDMPFCIAGGTQLCFGRGEVLEACTSSVAPMGVVLVKDPSVSVSTPWAYGECKRQRGDSYLKGESAFEQRRQRLRHADWLRPLRPDLPPPLQNDLQMVVAPQTTSVRTALDLLSSLPGQLRVAMSGSGPSCFALFVDREAADRALEHQRQALADAGLEVWSCSLQAGGVKLAP
ncbi:MAG: 4-(cytidine 5'-diphospho)-2-C-methyl-D-erythritol kinase [Synechococcus sp. TMED187]|nr:MAG: 4-(cytidine 5'-diphospho)-2-C-methyl-D-erythritol kinase [Synechococcus sp. TMED187]RZO12626.1 MAG: 4-(cytidine 5'-diphospho)-2-C-methyl-D-erythritol kinase [Synechococcus sp. MED-G135]